MRKVIWTAINIAAAAWALSSVFKNRKWKSEPPTREKAADILDRFLDGKDSPYEFTNLIDEYRGNDQLILQVVTDIWEIHDNYRPNGQRAFCNDEGMRHIRELAKLLRDNA